MKAKNRPIGWLWLSAAGCIVVAVGLVAGHLLLADNRLAQPAPSMYAPEPAQSWSCPTHPEVKLADPGKCPKCGTDLILPK